MAFVTNYTGGGLDLANQSSHCETERKTLEKELSCSRFSFQYSSQMKLLTETTR